MERSEVADLAQVSGHPGIDEDRGGVASAAMDDSMADGVDRLHRADGGLQLAGVEAPPGRLELAARQLGIVGADEAYLQRARACVDDEDARVLAGDRRGEGGRV